MTRRLEEDMLAHCDKVLDKEDTLRRRIHMFASHSEATIRMVKRKYDESHMDIDLLKREIQTNPISVRTGTEIISSVSVGMYIHKLYMYIGRIYYVYYVNCKL